MPRDNRAWEARRLRELLGGEVIETFARHRNGELLICFASGKRMFVDWLPDKTLDFSVSNFAFPKTSSVKRLKKRRRF